MDLTYARTEDAELRKNGEIEVWGDIDAVYMSTWRKAGMTLFIQFLKTLLVSGQTEFIIEISYKVEPISNAV